VEGHNIPSDKLPIAHYMLLRNVDKLLNIVQVSVLSRDEIEGIPEIKCQ
jgi:hypothetical protein